MKNTKNKYAILKTIFIFIILFSVSGQTLAAGKYFYTKEDLDGKRIEEGDTNSGFETKEACTSWTKKMNATWKPSVCYIGNDATITSVSPSSGKVGDIITIKGTDLNYIDSVSFNGRDAGYSSQYIQKQIKVTIPSGATSGQIKINTKYRGVATYKSFTINNNTDTYWWYLNIAKEYYGINGRLTTPGFTDENSCNTARLAYEKSSSQAKTTGPCFQETETQILKDKADSYGLEAEQETPAAGTTSSSYKLLAPIGTFTELTSSSKMGDYFNIMVEIAIGLCAVLAVIMLVIGGIQYMGSESIFGKTEARSQMGKSLLGLLIAVGAYALLNTISPALLGVGGLNIKQVSSEIVENFNVSGSSTVNGISVKINFNKEAYPAAKIASGKTGVDTAFILAMFSQETSNGANTGKCTQANANMGEGELSKLQTVMGRVKSNYSTKYKDVTWQNVNMSCSGGGSSHGGAIGFTQFLPSTWLSYSDTAKSILGHEPDPWNAADALMMTALFLKGNGGAGTNVTNQTNAACSYFGSCKAKISCGSGAVGTYGECVIAKKISIQKQIDKAIKDGSIK